MIRPVHSEPPTTKVGQFDSGLVEPASWPIGRRYLEALKLFLIWMRRIVSTQGMEGYNPLTAVRSHSDR